MQTDNKKVAVFGTVCLEIVSTASSNLERIQYDNQAIQVRAKEELAAEGNCIF